MSANIHGLGITVGDVAGVDSGEHDAFVMSDMFPYLQLAEAFINLYLKRSNLAYLEGGVSVSVKVEQVYVDDYPLNDELVLLVMVEGYEMYDLTWVEGTWTLSDFVYCSGNWDEPPSSDLKTILVTTDLVEIMHVMAREYVDDIVASRAQAEAENRMINRMGDDA